MVCVVSLGFVIAIDGPAGAGKSVVSSRLAARLGWPLVDTGAIYRSVTMLALRAGLDQTDGDAIAALVAGMQMSVLPAPPEAPYEYTIVCAGEDVTPRLFTAEIDRAVSRVAALPAVRAAALPLQRGAVAGNAVVVGRDIGTVVFPDARLKVYLDASPEERASRRHRQLVERGTPTDLAVVLAEIRRRDEMDGGRSAAPLRVAADAVRVGTDGLAIDDVVSLLASLYEDRCRKDAAQKGPRRED